MHLTTEEISSLIIYGVGLVATAWILIFLWKVWHPRKTPVVHVYHHYDNQPDYYDDDDYDEDYQNALLNEMDRDSRHR